MLYSSLFILNILNNQPLLQVTGNKEIKQKTRQNKNLFSYEFNLQKNINYVNKYMVKVHNCKFVIMINKEYKHIYKYIEREREMGNIYNSWDILVI